MSHRAFERVGAKAGATMSRGCGRVRGVLESGGLREAS